ncbi:Cardiolipin synthase C [Halioglobus japonicus]|nr:Cardiolipin synthase C [Halioglobus japonicus]
MSGLNPGGNSEGWFENLFGGFRARWMCALLIVCVLLSVVFSGGVKATEPWLEQACPACADKIHNSTGVFLLDYGQDSLLARAWLARNATTSIDVQYFIWSTDNVGILASTELLDAANRGVRIRVLVDDLMIDAQDTTLLALDAHENVDIRIYNPRHSVGITLWQRIFGILTDFRGANQRMHDKTAIFDGVAGITGGRNMADEYYDFDHHYNFRDRDVLLLGAAVESMSENFEEFWQSDLALPVSRLIDTAEQQLAQQDIDAHYQMLKEYARNPDNFAPEVRSALEQLSLRFSELAQHLVWGHVVFISDAPGKNDNRFRLDGSGESTDGLIEMVAQARESILIQSPYLVMPDGGIELFSELVRRGVRIRISTNSLASTDNLMAFSGYYKQREALLNAGVEIFEFRPDAPVRQQLIQRQQTSNSIFAIHAKSLLVDGKKVYIGTFNLDPRSANLNTEVGIVMDNAQLGLLLQDSIETDMTPQNSWEITPSFNPDNQVSWFRRMQLMFYSLLPMNALL